MDEINHEERSVESVQKILGFAKLDGTELKPDVQCLQFKSNLDNDSIRLMELDSSIVQFLYEGQRVVVRGSKTDTAVLCTENKTFDIRMAETSNAMLLLPECNVGQDMTSTSSDLTLKHRQVYALKHEYLELRPIKPRLKKLQQLLKDNVYNGEECEEDDQHLGRKYTLADLYDLVQASHQEIMVALADMHACLIKGFWRVMDTDFVGKIVQHITSLKEERGWSFDGIPAQVCLDELQDIFPRQTILHTLRCYSDLPEGSTFYEDSSIAEKQTYQLNDDKVCLFYAEMLFRGVQHFNLRDFCEAWQLMVPEGMNTGLYQLESIALVERDKTPEVIRYFPVVDLPEDVGDRFNYLFKTKNKWTLDDITPFVRDICTEKLTVGGYLLKYARASTQNGLKVYSSKKPLT